MTYEYDRQVARAHESLAELEMALAETQQLLDLNPDDANYYQIAKDLSLELKITQNEIEHLESMHLL